MSEQKPEKPAKTPPWWVPIVFAAAIGWLLNNLITIITFIATGVVNLSHVGIGPFLLALGLSVVCGLIGLILGIRLCFSVLFHFIAAIFHLIKTPRGKWTANQEKRFEATLFNLPEPDPSTRWEAIRYKASDIISAVLTWLLIPKWPSWPR